MLDAKSPISETGPGWGGSPRASATEADRTQRLRYQSGLAVPEADAVDHAVTGEPVVGGRVLGAPIGLGPLRR